MTQPASAATMSAAGHDLPERTLTGEDILCLSSIDWDFLWQGHQEIMSTLAARGNRVLFVENTGVRKPKLRDWPRLRQRIRNWRRGVWGIRQERPNLYIYAPIVLPFPYSRAAQWINRRILVWTIRRWMALMQAREPIIWTFLPTRLVLDVIRSVPHRLVLYYCIDNFEESSPEAARKVRAPERQLLREADLVFVTSQALAARCEPDHGRPTHWFPFGVALRHFAGQEAAAVPPELATLPRPLIGYVGGLHQWVDQALLRAVAVAMPDCAFVLVGPEQTDVSLLRSVPNIHCIGARPHEQLHAYVGAFDVCLIPYRLTEYTRNVYPTKLNEYLALGKPVVSTPLPEVLAFNAAHAEAVQIADAPEAFVAAVRTALSDDGQQAQRRQMIARTNDWEHRVTAMGRVIGDTLERRAQDRQRDWRAVLGAFYRTSRRRVMMAVAGALFLWGVLFHTSLPWWLAGPLRLADVPVPADAIVVLAGGMGESGQAGQGYEERVQYAIELYQRGLAPRLLLVSGFKYVFQEAEVMQAMAVARGVPADAIALEVTGKSTYDSLRAVAARLRAQGHRRYLLVSSPCHMRRAMLVARHVGPDLQALATPVPFSSFYGDGRRLRWRQLHAIAHEYGGILYYWWRGYLRPSSMGGA